MLCGSAANGQDAASRTPYMQCKVRSAVHCLRYSQSMLEQCSACTSSVSSTRARPSTLCRASHHASSPHEKTANRWKKKTDTPDTVNQSSLPRKQKVELIRWASRSFRARLKGPTSVDYRSALEPVSFLRFSGSKQVEGCWAKHKGAFGTLVSSG